MPQLEEFLPLIIFLQDGHHRIGFPVSENISMTIFPIFGLVEADSKLGLPAHRISRRWSRWGYIEYIVYGMTFPEINTQKSRIQDAVSTITGEMVTVTWREIEYCLNILRATNGEHFKIINHKKIVIKISFFIGMCK